MAHDFLLKHLYELGQGVLAFVLFNLLKVFHYVSSDIIAFSRLFFLHLGAHKGIIIEQIDHKLEKRD